MRIQNLLIFISLVAITALGCKKDRLDIGKENIAIAPTAEISATATADIAGIECKQWQQAMMKNDMDAVKTIMTQFIDELPSTAYTEQNLYRLATFLSGQCVSAEVICFDCIKTLPAQSEIKLSFVVSGSQVHKVIDLSSSPGNKMVFRGMHD